MLPLSVSLNLGYRYYAKHLPTKTGPTVYRDPEYMAEAAARRQLPLVDATGTTTRAAARRARKRISSNWGIARDNVAVSSIAMRITLIYPSVGRKENTPYVPRLADAAAVDGAARQPDAARRRRALLRRPHGGHPLRRADRPGGHQRRDVHRPARLQDRPAVSRPRRAGGHGRLSRHAAARRGGAARPTRSSSATPSRSGQQLLDDARHRQLAAGLRRPRPAHALAGVRPRREIFAGKPYQNITLVEFARGCNFKCDFCSITAFHDANQNHRPAREVAAEMEATGSRRFFIVDDNIVSQPAKVRELCRELIPLGVSWVGQASIHIAQDDELLELMVKSGCRGVLIGMESLDPANLRDMGKSWNLAGGSYAESLRRFREHGLAVYGTFVFGYDNDDAGVIAAERRRSPASRSCSWPRSII